MKQFVALGVLLLVLDAQSSATFQNNILTLSDIAVGTQRYQAQLQLQSNNQLLLTSAQAISSSVAPTASYDTTAQTLSVPKVAVGSQYYSALLQNQGSFAFAVSNLTPIKIPSQTAAWTQTGFRAAAPKTPRHVNRVLVQTSGRVHAAWYSQDNFAYMSYSDDQGIIWTHTALEKVTQIKQMIALSNGILVAGGSAFTGAPLLWASIDQGKTWAPKAATGSLRLPNASSEMIWDLAERNGEVIITTSHEQNDPAASHGVVYAWDPAADRLRTLASLPGIGALAVAVKSDGTIFVSTQESAEHDNAQTAGTGRVYRSSDGSQWTETGALTAANRVYALRVLKDGTIAAGSGLNGGFYYSSDGLSWTRPGTLPQGWRPFGDPAVLTAFPVTRVYQILELASGAWLIGTGNDTGDYLVSCDRGVSWHAMTKAGENIVSWGLAQAVDGTLWTGNGSLQGDVWKAVPPTGVSAGQFFGCV